MIIDFMLLKRSIIISLPAALVILLSACAASPMFFDGHQVIYQTDPVMTRRIVIDKNASEKCATVNKKARFVQRSCVPGGDCTTTYQCE